MTHAHLTTLVRQGLAALDHENTLDALPHFEEAAHCRETATILSCLGYCLAHERREIEKGLALCQEAVRQEPGNPLHYLNLGRVYLAARQKPFAMAAFQRGLEFGRHPGLLREIRRMGRRQPPVFPCLRRSHVLNRCCGYILSLLNLR
jgi:tetratricopeptide (TPR) repeat protein